MPSIKQRIKQLEKASHKSGFSLAQLKWFAKNVQGAGLIPGKYPEHVDYCEKVNTTDNRK